MLANSVLADRPLGQTLIIPVAAGELEPGDTGGAHRIGPDSRCEENQAARMTPRLRPEHPVGEQPAPGGQSPLTQGFARLRSHAPLPLQPSLWTPSLLRGCFPATDGMKIAPLMRPHMSPRPSLKPSALAEATLASRGSPGQWSRQGQSPDVQPGLALISFRDQSGSFPASGSAPGGSLASPWGTAPGLVRGS